MKEDDKIVNRIKKSSNRFNRKLIRIEGNQVTTNSTENYEDYHL
jgi:hypothetical protein